MPSKAMDQRELSNPNPSPPSPSVSSRLHVMLRALHFHVYVVGSTKAGMEGQFVPCVTTEVGGKEEMRLLHIFLLSLSHSL